MNWTEERVALLRQLWGEGKTAAEIAKALGGVTRNAVIGKAHRLKLSNRVSPIQQNNKKPVVHEIKPEPRRVVEVIAPGGVQMVDLREKMCRWPMGDPKDPEFRFCGATSVAGLPYCHDHAKAAYQPARSRTLTASDFDDAAPAEAGEAEGDIKHASNG